ncbi:hypothetical protein K469DRAFT_65239 [Zopfia rhizophila CBS 207.26]|uniref:Fungal N-terminal domain-containing protein n=1 Tax=Zopfia rhizophila CBS 207.26 TaxID=1314779 RepID=A0A6A6D904_9PEZI|nr:hypothetical protein K469DRAFT_65239 [Zopfia rhizophila CBS 207.26]
MAEVLGAIASIITLTKAAAKLSRLISSLQRAPDELLALSNDVTDMELLFLRIQAVQVEQPQALAPLSSTIRNATESIRNLTELVDKYSGRVLTGTRRLKWAVEKRKVNNLKQELRERRSQLDTLLTVNNLSIASRTHLAVSEIHINGLEAEKTARERHTLLDMQLQQIIGKLDGSNFDDKIHQKRNNPRLGSSAQPADVVEFSAAPLNCTVSCKCPCHIRTRLNFLSTILVGYTGSVVRSYDCHKNSCSGRSTAFKANLTYRFPRWFMGKAITSASKSPNLVILLSPSLHGTYCSEPQHHF